MATDPQTEPAEPAAMPAAVAEAPVAEGPEVAPAPAEPVPTGERLAQLFAQLRITKVVFVDDLAEPQTDAGSVFRLLSESPGASAALEPHFPGIELDIANPLLLDQLSAVIGQFDAARLQALGPVVAALSPDAAEREAMGLLEALMPPTANLHLLTPHGWHERRDALLADCTEASRTLFLFDQELKVDDVALGFTKGSDIIRDMAEKEKDDFGTRWFCGMLSHTLQTGGEVAAWRTLQQEENVDLRFFMPIAKNSLGDGPAFYGAVYRTLINTYCETMKGLASKAFGAALKDALDRFADLDPIDFEHAVVKSSEKEGVSELETLVRLYGIIQKDQVKAHILQDATVGEFTSAARAVKQIADIGRQLSTASQDRLHRLRNEELYESEQLVNSYNDPLRNGDIFEIGEGNSLKLWVLIAQPCDLMVRTDGERVREDNFKVAVLAPIRTKPLGQAEAAKDGLTFELSNFDHGGAQAGIVLLGDATPANLQVLDLAVLNKEGRCHIGAALDPNLRLAAQSWENRAKILHANFAKLTKQVEEIRKKHKDEVASLIAEAVIPRGSPKKAFNKIGAYEAGAFTYLIRRRGRVRDPLAASLLGAFSRHFARDAYGHDFSRAVD